MAAAVSPFLQISRLVAGFPNIVERVGHALKGAYRERVFASGTCLPKSSSPIIGL